MKTKIMLIIVASFIIIIILASDIKFKYSENTLYKQSKLMEYSNGSDESDQLITRNEAINIAEHIMKDVMNIDINSEDYEQSINLYKSFEEHNADTNGNDSGELINGEKTIEEKDVYKWRITWTKSDLSKQYIIDISSNKGKVTELLIIEENLNNIEKPSTLLSNESVISIVKGFTDSLGIDIELYHIMDKVFNGNYQTSIFVNKEKLNDQFEIDIDLRTNTIVGYKIKR